MLVLTRKRDEVIVFTLPDGTKFYVTVIELRGDKVRLGIDAPADVAIHRFEVDEAIQREIGHGATVPPGKSQPRAPWGSGGSGGGNRGPLAGRQGR